MSNQTIPKSIEKELKLPVSFTRDGKEVTLIDFMTTKRNVSLSLSSLKPSQLAEITIDRIKQKPEVKLMMLGSDVIDKERAIAEIEAQSPIGMVLIEAEQYEIEDTLEEIEKYYKQDILDKYNHSHVA